MKTLKTPSDPVRDPVPTMVRPRLSRTGQHRVKRHHKGNQIETFFQDQSSLEKSNKFNEGQELSKEMNNGTRKQSMRKFCKIVLTGKVFLFPSVETNHNNEAAALRI